MRLLLLLLVACGACGSGASAAPDAAMYNPTGTWKLALLVGADPCNHPAYSAASEVTITCADASYPVTSCTIVPFSGPAGESVLPGASISCQLDHCDGVFSLQWSDASYHLQEFQSAHFAAMAMGTGEAVINSGSGGGCVATFSFTGALQ